MRDMNEQVIRTIPCVFFLPFSLSLGQIRFLPLPPSRSKNITRWPVHIRARLFLQKRDYKREHSTYIFFRLHTHASTIYFLDIYTRGTHGIPLLAVYMSRTARGTLHVLHIYSPRIELSICAWSQKSLGSCGSGASTSSCWLRW
jgi:hypothetical protein